MTDAADSSILASYRDLLDGPLTGLLTTVGPDGPHAAPVWFVFDGECVLVSTRSATQKHRNIARDPRVSFTVIDPTNTMRYVEFRGLAEALDDPTFDTRERVVRKHGFETGAGFDPPDVKRVSIRVVPRTIIKH